jgi:hypothetical protein
MSEPEMFSTEDLLCHVHLEAAPGSLHDVPALAVWVGEVVDALLFDRAYIMNLLTDWEAKTALAQGVDPAEEYQDGQGNVLDLGFETLGDGRRLVSLYRDRKLRAGIPLEFLVLPLMEPHEQA